MTGCRLLSLKLILWFILISPAAAGSAGFVVRGKVLEEGTRKPLEGITVYSLEREEESTISDRDGGFTLVAGKPGRLSLVGAAIGYERSKPFRLFIDPSEETEEVILHLKPVYSMKEVVVQADRNQDRTAKTTVSGTELVAVAGSGGDPVRGMAALPGITTASDTGNAPAMRGSGPGDNAYYVDFLPVGYLFHFGGGLSVVNAALVDNFNIYTSSFGPEFANVIGGVVDVKLRDPRTDRIGGHLGLSTDLIGAQVNGLLEGPISNNKGFYLAARRSYADLFMSKSRVSTSDVAVRQIPEFYDYQGKFVWNLSDSHSLTLQTSGADDEMKLTFSPDAVFVKHDPILAGDFNYAQSYRSLGAVLASKFSPLVNNKFGISYLNNTADQSLTQLGHIHVKQDSMIVRDHLNSTVGDDHEVLFGIDYDATRVGYDLDVPLLVPSMWDPNTDYTSASRFASSGRFTVNSWGLSLKDRWKIASPLTLVVGGRASQDDYLDRRALEPRLGAEYIAMRDTLVTAGWGKYHQFPAGYQVLEGFGNPHLGYEKADHYDLGVERQISSGWSVKAEEYYKKLYDLVIPHQPENYVNGGSGKAYGTELFLKKDRTDNWWGWISVAYSRTQRHNDLTGEDFSFGYDQPYIVNIVYDRMVFQKWIFGAAWRYHSGAPYTPIVGSYTDATGRIRPVYGEHRSERLPPYHALNLSMGTVVWSGKQQVTFGIEIVNVYDRKNISGYDYNVDYTERRPIREQPLWQSIGIQVAF
jgi:TonB-dependent receptor-like protein/carboxypeptidase-like protein